MHKIYINCRFLTQPMTGVQRYSYELITTIDQLVADKDPAVANLDFRLIAPRRGWRHEMPLKVLKIQKIGQFSGHIWEQTEFPFVCMDGLVFNPGNTAPLVSLYWRKPTVVTVHDLSYLYFPNAYSIAFRSVYQFLMPRIFNKANAVITVSNAEKISILKHFSAAKTSYMRFKMVVLVRDLVIL